MTIFRDTIHHPRLVQLYDYWNGIRGDRTMPARGDMDPIDIPDLLANFVLLDVEHAPLRFCVRVFGTAVTAAWSADITGRYLDELEDTSLSQVFIRGNRQVAETMAPHIIEAPHPDISSQSSTFHCLGLPLSEDGSRVNMIPIGCYREFGTPEEAPDD